MKNFLLAVFGLFAALPLCAANNIKMVTYFPVPYASYNDLKVSGTCDVGLLDDCTLDAGSSLRVLKDVSRTNNEGKLEVLRGGLSLNGSGSVYGNSLQFGINSVSGGELQFKHNLNVTTMPGSVITSIQVSNQAKLNKLNLFEKYEFPGCDGTDNEINWKRLTVNGAEGVFLVCGAGKETECRPTHNGEESYTETCPTGQTGKITYTWDSASCSYRKLSTCKSNTKKRCLTKLIYCGNISYTRLNEGSGGGSGLGNDCSMYTNGNVDLPYQIHISTSYGGDELREAGYKTGAPVGCTAGSECASCTLGQKYALQSYGWGVTCGNRTIVSFPYAVCEEKTDCSSGTVQSCRRWNGGPGVIGGGGSGSGGPGGPSVFDPLL